MVATSNGHRTPLQGQFLAHGPQFALESRFLVFPFLAFHLQSQSFMLPLLLFRLSLLVGPFVLPHPGGNLGFHLAFCAVVVALRYGGFFVGCSHLFFHGLTSICQWTHLLLCLFGFVLQGPHLFRGFQEGLLEPIDKDDLVFFPESQHPHDSRHPLPIELKNILEPFGQRSNAFLLKQNQRRNRVPGTTATVLLVRTKVKFER
mmetsp:Transcript_26880/g.73906  ORF Transcript_26880/g.73906 Transcript_26880/m.73906 type:complete len:203 (+) Transcript_26880:1878-2486(+)